MINRFLADTLSVLNGLFAIIIIAVGAAVGYRANGVPTLILGGFFGVIAASLTCGIIAYFALIEGHLRTLANGRAERETSRPPRSRSEPSF